MEWSCLFEKLLELCCRFLELCCNLFRIFRPDVCWSIIDLHEYLPVDHTTAVSAAPDLQLGRQTGNCNKSVQ